MDDDLFTYEVEIPGLSYIPYVVQQVDNSDDGDLGVYEKQVCFDENESVYVEAVLFIKDMLKRGDDEVVLTDEEISDIEDENLINENEIAEIFKIKTDILTSKHLYERRSIDSTIF
nr:hypothetical protein [Tanacetum cinerariifolium]